MFITSAFTWVFACLFFLCNLQLVRAGWMSTCYNSASNCTECVRMTSGLGYSNCRWCPNDEHCYAFQSMTNPCSSAEYLWYEHDCSAREGAYSPTLAWKSVRLCSVAYSSNATHFLSFAFLEHRFTNVFQVFKGKYSGFTATWPAERLIVIAFRGSKDTRQVKDQVIDISTTARADFLGGLVQNYFLKGFNDLWNHTKLGEKMLQLASDYPEYRILVTGHSLGGAIASIASTSLAKHFQNSYPKRVMMYTFGMPRVGNQKYAIVHDDHVEDSWRVTQANDPVVHVPPMYSPYGSYDPVNIPFHHGREIFFDSRTKCGENNIDYRTCPRTEDPTCAYKNGLASKNPCNTAECILDHKIYLGIAVGEWWQTAEDRSKTFRTKRSVTQCRECELNCVKPNITLGELLATVPTAGAVNAGNQPTSFIWMVCLLIGFSTYVEAKYLYFRQS